MQRYLQSHIEYYEVGTLAVDWWAVYSCRARRGLGGPARPGHWLLRYAKKHLYAIYRLVRIQEFIKGEAVTAVDERPPQAENFFFTSRLLYVSFTSFLVN